MKKRPLGKTGIAISELAFGGVEIGMPYGIGVNSVNDMIQEADAIRLLHASVDKGINFFDTARLYGQSESIMGKAFYDRRDKVVVATKCKHLHDADGNIPSPPALRTLIETSLEESLAALQTDYVDVFMLHQASKEILENEYVAEIFLSLKKEGRIRATGVSTYTPAETGMSIAAGAWDLIQLPFNLLNQEHERFFASAAEQGIAIVIRSVLLKGLLSDRAVNLHPALVNVEDHIKLYQQLLNKRHTDLPALAIKFALSFPEVAAVVIGIDRLEYLTNALVAANGDYLDDKTFQLARSLAYAEPDFLNLAEWSKKGWLV